MSKSPRIQPATLREPGSLEENVTARMRTLHEQYGQVMAVLPEILGTPELRKRYLEQFVLPVSAVLEQDLTRLAQEKGETAFDATLAARILLGSVLGFQVLMIIGDPLTHSVWDNPELLAKVWSRFMTFGLRESKG